ncbi:MAG: Rpp14/Pop5 family protein [Candidatus Bathyarchaeia archaeon]
MGRWRYLLLEALSEEPVDGEGILDALRRSLKELFGQMGLMEANPKLLYSLGRYSVIRCPKGEVERIRASLILLSDALGRSIPVRVRKSSGTLRALRAEVPSGQVGGIRPDRPDAVQGEGPRRRGSRGPRGPSAPPR